MSRRLLATLLASVVWQSVCAADADPCTHYTWDISHELAVLKQTAQPITAASKPASDVPKLQLDKAYAVTLADQGIVAFAAPPAKQASADGARAGLVRFTTAAAGLYRISLNSGHWIDVVDGKSAIKSQDFQGAHGCERPRKIVEFELPANKELTLQLSGAPSTPVILTVTSTTTGATP